MGNKNKPLSSRDKSSKDSKSKKDKGDGGSPKAEIVVRLDDKQAAKSLKSAKVITVQDLARQTGVKISAANAYLRQAAKNGTVKRVGGYSGHRIYQQVQSDSAQSKPTSAPPPKSSAPSTAAPPPPPPPPSSDVPPS